jgi:hypothetical protein
MTKRVLILMSILWIVLSPMLLLANMARKADFDGDGSVGFGDFLEFAGAYSTSQVKYDLDGSGTVDFPDFLAFASVFGQSVSSTIINVEDANIIKDSIYSPAFDKHAIAHNIVIVAFPDVTDGFLTNVANILHKILQKDAATDDARRDLLLDNFLKNKFLQRVGSVGPENYADPGFDEIPGFNKVNDEHEVVDFIWELELNEEVKGKTQAQRDAQQVNEIVEHLLHTITNGFNKTFNSWEYQNQSSALNLAMAEAINGKYYDVQSYEEIRARGDVEGYQKIIVQEFIYWVILTGWDLKTPYKPNTSPEWYVEDSQELQTKLPLAYKLFTDEVSGVLVNPTQMYLDNLIFESIVD